MCSDLHLFHNWNWPQVNACFEQELASLFSTKAVHVFLLVFLPTYTILKESILKLQCWLCLLKERIKQLTFVIPWFSQTGDIVFIVWQMKICWGQGHDDFLFNWQMKTTLIFLYAIDIRVCGFHSFQFFTWSRKKQKCFISALEGLLLRLC